MPLLLPFLYRKISFVIYFDTSAFLGASTKRESTSQQEEEGTRSVLEQSRRVAGPEES